MTITERNQKLYELRKQLDKKRMELAWIETEIMAVNSQYDRENRETPLFEEMFEVDNTNTHRGKQHAQINFGSVL